MKPVIIGIAGGTGSGKTTVARSIYDRVGKDRIEWVSHDSYYRNFEGLDPEQRHHINFDHPDSLETELLCRHLDVLSKGSSVEVPIYDFTTHSRKAATQRVEPRKVIIVEGILVLAEPELRKRIDIKLFVDTPSDIRFLRRLMRDIQSRGRSVESVIDQYMTTVRPMHEEFVEPSKRHADLIIPEGGENLVALDAIISRVEHLLA
ncbi:MAG: uridine kinase [Acidobacteria bacterium]|nr:uridine kinase [Acidobacteriota bacterium]MBV9474627.1 uridine kinase [Acidobacteriota bacterium]